MVVRAEQTISIFPGHPLDPCVCVCVHCQSNALQLRRRTTQHKGGRHFTSEHCSSTVQLSVLSATKSYISRFSNVCLSCKRNRGLLKSTPHSIDQVSKLKFRFPPGTVLFRYLHDVREYFKAFRWCPALKSSSVYTCV